MNILDRLRGLPEKKKKIILWAIMIIVAIFLFKLYIQNIQKGIKYIDGEKIKEELHIPELEQSLKELPKFEIPSVL